MGGLLCELQGITRSEKRSAVVTAGPTPVMIDL